jgi:hypothetical protein
MKRAIIAALLFYLPTPNGPLIWCFSPEPLT